jgi:Flp pilus assembly secretin CpaC
MHGKTMAGARQGTTAVIESQRPRRAARPRALAARFLLAFVPFAPAWAAQQGTVLAEYQASGGSRNGQVLTLVEGSQARLKFSRAIQTGQQVSLENANPDVCDVRVVSADEILLRGKKVGRSNLMVWFREGGPESFDIVVRRDLSVLESALLAVHPSLRVEAAGDRDALVLTGTVPDGQVAMRAVQAARDYAEAGAAEGVQARILNLVRVQSAPSSLEEVLQAQVARLGAPEVRVSRLQKGAVADDAADIFVLSGSAPSSRVLDDAIDLVAAAIGQQGGRGGRIVVQVLVGDRPGALEIVIERAIHEQLGCREVRVDRIVGTDSDGSGDILVMTGKVPTQIALTRALTLAAKVFRQQDLVARKRAGEYERITETFAGGLTRTRDTPLTLDNVAQDINVAADESGALFEPQGAGADDDDLSRSLRAVLSTPNGGLGGTGGGGLGSLLENRIDQNIARAKAVELAEGRILSFIEVQDIPQVRVAIRVMEISRTDLLNWNSDINQLTIADFDTNGVNPNNISRDASGDILVNANGEPILGASGTDVANVISFLEAGFANQILVGGEHFNLDAVFSVLETEGVARSLASPNLTVLSGEIASFGDGGSVSISSSVTTNTGGGLAGTGVFETVQLLPFGIQLAVRPLVGEDGFITLDVAPSISNPDFQLTALVRATTGTPQETVAFAEKNLRTSARLRDGEVLLIGGLTDRSRKDEVGKTPFLGDLPLIGWLFQDKKFEDKDREVFIVVSPTIVRDRPTLARLWAYPDSLELLGRATPAPPPPEAAHQDGAGDSAERESAQPADAPTASASGAGGGE